MPTAGLSCLLTIVRSEPRRAPSRRSPTRRACVVTWLLLASTVCASEVRAQGLVKVTPLGSHDGELCVQDRALLFEDPTGVRILYDPGFTVDETDPRLGDVDVMLLSHAHSDHIGERRPGRGGSCAAPAQGALNPFSNFASIAAVKRAAAFLVSSDLDTFIGRKIENMLGTPTPLCVARSASNETLVPRSSPCVSRVHPGGSLVVRRVGAASGVRIAAVQAAHPSGIPASLLESPGAPPGTSGYGGIAGGYVVLFTNGLIAYLTGDTGLSADIEVVAKFYRPNLVVINIGDVGGLGPTEAAFAVREMTRPTSVMPSHVYEQSTEGGAVRPGSRVDQFTRLVQHLEGRDGYIGVVVPLSGVTRTFDGEGRCAGCR